MSLSDFYTKTLPWQDCPCCLSLFSAWFKHGTEETFGEWASRDHDREEAWAWYNFMEHFCDKRLPF